MSDMVKWEYTAISLIIGQRDHPRTADDWHRAIARLGAQGWEAVGQITISDGFSPTLSNKTPHLLFKRPLA